MGRFIMLALGLMAKPMLVTWPFVMLLLDYWPLGRCRRSGALVGAIDLKIAQAVQVSGASREAATQTGRPKG